MPFIKTIKQFISGGLKSFSPTSIPSMFNFAGKGGGLRLNSAASDPAGAYAGWVYTAISKRAKRVGAIDLELYDLKRSGDLEEINDHEFLALLHRANPKQSKYQFFYTLELLLGIWGSAPVFKDRCGGTKVQYLWPLRPDLLTAKSNDRQEITSYEYRVGGNVMKIAAEDIVNINEPSPVSLTLGHSPVMAAGLEIDADNSAALWNKHLLENFAEPGGVLTTEQKLSDAEFERIQKTWNSRHQGATNAGRWALLEKGLEAKALGRGPKDMDLNETRRFHRNAITGILGVPMSLITSENVNLANAQAGERIFAKDTVEPQMTLITGALSEFVAQEFGDTLWLTFESPVPNDTETDIKLATAGEGRWLTVNEARDIFNLPALEGGDAIFKPMGVMPQVGDDRAPDEPGTPKGMHITGYEKIHVETGPTRKHKQIIQAIKARSFMSRKNVEGFKEKVGASLEKHIKAAESGGKVRIKAITVKSDDDEDEGFTHDTRHVAERKEYMKALPQREKRFRNAMRKLFMKQYEEILDNVESEGLPKGRGGRMAAKSTSDKWINKIMFDEKAANDALLATTGELYRTNIKEGSEAVAGLLGIDASDVLASPFVITYVEKQSFNALVINQTTKKALRKTLQEGLAVGESTGEIRDRIEATFKDATGYRAEAIARTETTSAQNFGRTAEMKNQKVEKQIWLATFSKTRGDHQEADGSVVNVGENFIVGGEELAHPGDPSGSAGNIINCQCTASPTLKPLT